VGPLLVRLMCVLARWKRRKIYAPQGRTTPVEAVGGIDKDTLIAGDGVLCVR